MRLGVIANLMADRVDGERTVNRVLAKALMKVPSEKHFTMLGKVKLVALQAQRQQRSVTAVEVLMAMDEEFSKMTGIERSPEIREQLADISIVSTRPSGMIDLAQALYGQQFASVADSTTREQLVVDAVRTFISGRRSRRAPSSTSGCESSTPSCATRTS